MDSLHAAGYQSSDQKRQHRGGTGLNQRLLCADAIRRKQQGTGGGQVSESDGRDTVASSGDAALGDVGQRRQVRIAGIHFMGRRRRPSGEKAPLPRELKRSGWFWLAAAFGLTALWLSSSK